MGQVLPGTAEILGQMDGAAPQVEVALCGPSALLKPMSVPL